MENPLLEPFEIAPFSKIKNEHFTPAFHTAIEAARTEIDVIVNNPEAPSFKNTIAALDFSGYQLDRISSVFFNLNAAETNEEIQKIAQEVSPLLSAFSNDISLNVGLFKRVKAVYDNFPKDGLSQEELTLLEKRYKSFSFVGLQSLHKTGIEMHRVNHGIWHEKPV